MQQAQEVQATNVLVHQKTQRMENVDRTVRIIFMLCAILLILVIVGVFVFVGANALRLFFVDKHGPSVISFFTSAKWDPQAAFNDTPQFGALGLIIGSIVITILSALIATPLAFGFALFFTEVAPRWLVNFFQPLLEVFAGMPSVVIGFLGLVFLIPFLQKATAPITGGSRVGGYGWGAATIVLLIMILPTITSISIDALRAVPGSVREASLALGSTRWQMMSRAVLPSATTGLVTAVILGLSRAIGETLAVSMVLGGNGYGLPSPLLALSALFLPSSNITRSILEDFLDTFGTIRDAYWMLAFVLLVISFLFVCLSRYFASRSVYK